MSLDTPQFRRSMQEADFLRERLIKLQEHVEDAQTFGDAHLDYLHTLYALIEKEHIIFTRLKLIDTIEAHLAIQNLDAYKIIAFLPRAEQDDMTPDMLYPAVKLELISLIKELSGDDWDPNDFDIDDEDW